MKFIVGIDPGLTGGLAILGEPGGRDCRLQPMPDTGEVFKELEFCKEMGPTHVYVEKAQSFPGQGIASAFNYGRHFGELLGILTALRIPHTLVSPRTWTKVIHAGTKGADPKVRTLEAVRRLFPGVNLQGSANSKKPHEGIVDALAIAEYGRRQQQGATS
jgi:crossover junction endodeoxyribonuclease RuvC